MAFVRGSCVLFSLRERTEATGLEAIKDSMLIKFVGLLPIFDHQKMALHIF